MPHALMHKRVMRGEVWGRPGTGVGIRAEAKIESA